MARPAIGAAARTEVVCARFTEAEKQWLEARYGKAARGVRAIVKAAIPAHTPEEDPDE